VRLHFSHNHNKNRRPHHLQLSTRRLNALPVNAQSLLYYADPEITLMHLYSMREKFSCNDSLPKLGHCVLLVGKRSLTQVLAKSLLQIEKKTNYFSPTSSDQLWVMESLQRTLSNCSSASDLLHRRVVHMAESLDDLKPLREASIDHIVLVTQWKAPLQQRQHIWQDPFIQTCICSISDRDHACRVTIVAMVTETPVKEATREHGEGSTRGHYFNTVPIFACHPERNASMLTVAGIVWNRALMGARTHRSPVSPFVAAKIL
jgi:hypothetical protein